MMSSVPNYYAGYSNYSSPRYVDTNGQEVLDPSVAPASVSLAPPQQDTFTPQQAPVVVEAPPAPEDKKNAWLAPTLAVIGGVGLTLLTLAATGNLGGAKKAAEKTVEQVTKEAPKVVDDLGEQAAKQTPEVVEKVVENTVLPKGAIADLISKLDFENKKPKELAQQILANLPDDEVPALNARVQQQIASAYRDMGHTHTSIQTHLNTITPESILAGSSPGRINLPTITGAVNQRPSIVIPSSVKAELKRLEKAADNGDVIAEQTLRDSNRFFIQGVDDKGKVILGLRTNSVLQPEERVLAGIVNSGDRKAMRKLPQIATEMGYTVDSTGDDFHILTNGSRSISVPKFDAETVDFNNYTIYGVDGTTINPARLTSLQTGDKNIEKLNSYEFRVLSPGVNDGVNPYRPPVIEVDMNGAGSKKVEHAY